MAHDDNGWTEHTRGRADDASSLLALLPSRFEPTDLLGRGGQKAVYRARDVLLERDVAVAAFDTAQLGAQKDHLLREARIMARVGGTRHVVSIFDVIESRQAAFIISEYMPGGDLSAALSLAGDRGAWSTERVVRLGIQMCDALAAAHQRGVVHLDVKPANILLDVHGDAFLSDFGLARFGDQGGEGPGTLTGTPCYLAPEQIYASTADFRCDLYALGTVLFELLAGVLPLTGDSIDELLYRKLNTTPAPVVEHRPDVPPLLSATIAALLERNPEARPASAVALRDALDACTRSTAAPQHRAPTRAPLPPSFAVEAPTLFVGRDSQVLRLDDAWQRACRARRIHAVALVGEPGIGKTRLAHEFARIVHAGGATVLLGAAREEPLVPYQPIVEATRFYVNAVQPRALFDNHEHDLADLVALVPDVASLLPSRASPPESDAETRRYRMFGSVQTLLAFAAETAPLLLVLEDLHWADRSTLLLLSHLVHSDEPMSLLVLLTYRPTDVTESHPLSAVLAELHRQQRLLRVDMDGLDENCVHRLLASMTGGDVPLPAASALHERTDGNPFFITEMVRDLLDRHTSPTALEWHLAFRGKSLAIPRGIEEVVRHRAARLEPASRSVLHCAAVIGREFDADLLGRVADLPQERLVDLLEPALERAIVTEVPAAPGRYRFTHSLTRDTLHRQLSSARRVRLHLAVAGALEAASSPDSEQHIADLAYHYGEAGEAGKALSFALRAAAQANRRLAYQEAADLYARALEALDRQVQDNVQLRCEILLARADALWNGGETSTAERVAYDAAAAARTARAPQLLARAALAAGGKLSGLHIGVLDERLIALLEESLAQLENASDPLRARVMARLAEALTSDHHGAERRIALARDSIALAHRTADLVSLAEVLRHAHWSLWGPYNAAERLEISVEMERLAFASEARGLAMSGRGWRLVDLLELGQVEEFEHELDAYSKEAAELRQPVFLYVAHVRRIMVSLLRGRFAEAEAGTFHTLTLGERAQVGTAAQVFGAQMFAIRQEQGRLAELEPAIQAIRAQYPHNAGWPIALAHLYCQAGRADEAARELDLLARRGFASLPRDLTWNVVMAYLARVCLILDDAVAARMIYSLHDGEPAPCVVAAGTAPLGSGARTLALLATATREWSEAERWFEAALAGNARLGSPPWLAHTQLDFAEMLRKRGRSGDAARARKLGEAARRTADELAMTALLQQIQGLDL